jgi:energy-coupling factor transporter ATP-binding protein EcfA2
LKNSYQQFEAGIKSLHPLSFFAQVELCPSFGKLHIQFFVRFSKNIKPQLLQHLFPGIHLEIPTKPQLANERYCLKDLTYVSDYPRIIFNQSLSTTPSNDQILNLSISDLFQQFPNFTLNKINQIEKLKSHCFKPSLLDFKQKIVVYITGPSGSGKSRLSSSISKKLLQLNSWRYWKHSIGGSSGSLFFNNYSGEEIAHFDEFRSNIKFNEFLQIIDGFPLIANSKGSSCYFWPDLVILSSVHPFDSLYPTCSLDGEPKEQLIQRIHFRIEFSFSVATDYTIDFMTDQSVNFLLQSPFPEKTIHLIF